MTNSKIVIAIDGPAAAGKSTAGKILARELGYLYIDTGALYRAVALKAMQHNISFTDGPSLQTMIKTSSLKPARNQEGMRMILDGKDITDQLRGEDVGYAASTVSAQPEVRSALLNLQRELGQSGGIVIDGRDIGTVIFPQAEAKFFLDASPEERGKRRYLEMESAGQKPCLEDTIVNIKKRDRQDSERQHAPLKKAANAILIDTTNNNPQEVISLMREHINRILTSDIS